MDVFPVTFTFRANVYFSPAWERKLKCGRIDKDCQECFPSIVRSWNTFLLAKEKRQNCVWNVHYHSQGQRLRFFTFQFVPGKTL